MRQDQQTIAGGDCGGKGGEAPEAAVPTGDPYKGMASLTTSRVEWGAYHPVAWCVAVYA
ncbi:MAG: hypothetical protein R3F22_11595 [Lysobacteraceae bacterium]